MLVVVPRLVVCLESQALCFGDPFEYIRVPRRALVAELESLVGGVLKGEIVECVGCLEPLFEGL